MTRRIPLFPLLEVVLLPGTLLPLPGESVPVIAGGTVATGISPGGATTQVLVPPTTPITQVYTPAVTGGQRYIINQGAVFTPGDGTIYYINPGYSGYVPGYVYPPPVCPPGAVITQPRAGIGATIQSGSTTIRIGR